MSLLDDYEHHIQEQSKPKSLLEQYEQHLDETQPTPSTPLLEQVESSREPRALHEEVFAHFISEHRPHQVQAVAECANKNIGQVIIPTGTGKTRVQIHLHIQDMIEKTKNNEIGVYAIGAHRLLLCKQLMDELQHLCIQCGIPINVLYVGSARQDDKAVYDRYFKEGIDQDTFESTYTTVGKEVKEFYEKTQASKRHLIIVSTYHSFDRLKNIPCIDLCTFDEAHTTVAEDFSKNIEKVFPQIKRNFFFTATRKIRGQTGGMNDEKKYGEILCCVSPRAMIEAGEIVPPKIHTIKLENDLTGAVSEKNRTMLVKTVTEAFTKHKERLKKDSKFPDMIGAKLLVSAKGSEEINLIHEDETFQTWCKENAVKVFSYSSKFGSYENFEEEVNRNKVYESMRDLKDTEDCILLHIDILTEGIDLPSITGVLLLRHLNEVKLFQALGRALRLLKDDRKKLYNGEMFPQDKHLFIKPYAYLILPMHFVHMDESAIEMKITLQKVISEYGIPTEEFLPPETYDGKSTDYMDPVTDRKLIDKKEKDYPLQHVIEDLVIESMIAGIPEDPIDKYEKVMSLINSIEKGDQ